MSLRIKEYQLPEELFAGNKQTVVV